MRYSWWRRLVRAGGWIVYAGLLILGIWCIKSAIVCSCDGTDCGWIPAGATLLALWIAASMFIGIVIRDGEMKDFNMWARLGMFKVKNIDKTRRKIIAQNHAIMDTITSIAEQAMQVARHRECEVYGKIKLQSAMLYVTNSGGKLDNGWIVKAMSKHGLIFHFVIPYSLVDCDINNIFALPVIAEELAVILDGYQDDKQVAKRKRQDAESDFKAYVEAVSEML